jgi:hypothetical protein
VGVIRDYPEFSEIATEMRAELHERFRLLEDGISEFTFANIYLFRAAHEYRISRAGEGVIVIVGRDAEAFFMLPFGIPEEGVLRELFGEYRGLKCASESQAEALERMGYQVEEDRDNFDYLYLREDLVKLTGRKLHRKKNLVNVFIRDNKCTARPLLEEYVADAMEILERWRALQGEGGDYEAAREGLERMEELQLCGGIFYIGDEPVAYCLGEEVGGGRTFVIHFEKAVVQEQYKGLYQFVNQSFAAVLPEKYETVNREQDLGDLGLRQAKESYKPAGFVKKYRVRAGSSV